MGYHKRPHADATGALFDVLDSFNPTLRMGGPQPWWLPTVRLREDRSLVLSTRSCPIRDDPLNVAMVRALSR